MPVYACILHSLKYDHAHALSGFEHSAHGVHLTEGIMLRPRTFRGGTYSIQKTAGMDTTNMAKNTPGMKELTVLLCTSETSAADDEGITLMMMVLIRGLLDLPTLVWSPLFLGLQRGAMPAESEHNAPPFLQRMELQTASCNRCESDRIISPASNRW